MSYDMSGLGGDVNWFPGQYIDVPQQLDVLPDGAQSVMIGDVSQFAAFNHQQGDNPYGITGDCGLVSCQDVLNQFGQPVTETEVLQHAAANGECNIDPASAADSGGSSPQQQAEILNDYGVPAQVEKGQSVEELATYVEEGHSVIASVNAGVLWDDPAYYEGGGDNHAVTVTGVARDPMTGAIQGFYINDSGDGKSAEFVSATTMQEAFTDQGGNAVVTDAVHPGTTGA
jgi:hypothetical protein